MVIRVEQQASSYPLPAYNFRVTRAGQTMRFAKVSGLQREHKVLTYRDGLSFLDGELIARYHVDHYISIPINLTAPTFDAKSNEVAIDFMELKAAGITIVPLA